MREAANVGVGAALFCFVYLKNLKKKKHTRMQLHCTRICFQRAPSAAKRRRRPTPPCAARTGEPRQWGISKAQSRGWLRTPRLFAPTHYIIVCNDHAIPRRRESCSEGSGACTLVLSWERARADGELRDVRTPARRGRCGRGRALRRGRGHLERGAISAVPRRAT